MIDLQILEHILLGASLAYNVYLHKQSGVTKKQHDYYVSVDLENKRLQEENAQLRKQLDNRTA